MPDRLGHQKKITRPERMETTAARNHRTKAPSSAESSPSPMILQYYRLLLRWQQQAHRRRHLRSHRFSWMTFLCIRASMQQTHPGPKQNFKRSEQRWVPAKHEPAHGAMSSQQRYSVFVSLRPPVTLYTTEPVRRLQHQENSGMAFIYSVSATCGQC